MKAVITNTDQKSQIKPHNLCKFQKVCTTVPTSVISFHLLLIRITRLFKKNCIEKG